MTTALTNNTTSLSTTTTTESSQKPQVTKAIKIKTWESPIIKGALHPGKIQKSGSGKKKKAEMNQIN